jgi:hypothetical protein
MTRPIHKAHTHCKNLKQAVFVLAVLTSLNALAATPPKTAEATGVADLHGRQVTMNPAPVDPYEAIKWRNSTGKSQVAQHPVHKTSRFRTSSNITRADTRKVFKQDYERILAPVGSSKSTKMIWLAD